jgi:hypothetical protein
MPSVASVAVPPLFYGEGFGFIAADCVTSAIAVFAAAMALVLNVDIVSKEVR